MKSDKRNLYRKKRIKELEDTISVQKKQIKFLTQENEHLSDSNNELDEKISEVCRKLDQVSTEYSNKLIELNRAISGYNAAKKSLNCIRLEYEKKVKSLIDKLC